METLSWHVDAGGVRFEVRADGVCLPVESWLLHELRSPAGAPVSAGPLVPLLQDDLAFPVGQGVYVPHRAIPDLTDAELRLLGLPQRRDPSVSIRARGATLDVDFRLEVGLAYAGRGERALEREGAFIAAGAERHVLSPATFALLEQVDAFNARAANTFDDRMRGWAEVRKLVGVGASLDPYLSELRVLLATRFALRPHVNEAGEPDFDIAFVDPVSGDSLLEGRRSDDFNRHFRSKPSVHSKYAIGSGTHVMCDGRMKGALAAAHAAVRGSVAERKAFLRAPHAHMRAALPEDFVDLDLGDVFHEGDLSERVKAVGIFEARVLPWLTRTGHSWLPAERAGLEIDGRRIELKEEEAHELLASVRAGVLADVEHVEFRGERVPATAETAYALEHVVRELASRSIPPEAEREAAATEEVSAESEGRRVLQIHANLEELEYRERGTSRARLPRGVAHFLRTPLLAHQEEALEHLCAHYEAGHPGALLADDMGLGKTLTALSFMGWLKTLQNDDRIPAKPSLLVAPTGLLRTWAKESETHLEHKALGYRIDAHGASLKTLRVAAKAKELDVGLPVLDVGHLQRADWVLTTYETLRDYQHSFGRVSWGCVVFDEAQKVKNPSVAMTDAAKAMNAGFRVAMTGTPVENRLTDLWSIVDTVHAGKLGALKDFVRKYEGDGPEVRSALHGLHGALTAPPPFMIRRMKEGHLKGLPEREFHLERELMPDAQATAYTECVRGARGAKAEILRTLDGLRQVSLHPDDPPAALDDARFIAASARWKVLVRCLDRIHKAREKALVFVEYRDAQAALVGVLQRRYHLDRAPLIISGAVSGTARQARVDDFQGRSGFDVMILSPRAAGVGLTITAANHVIHLTRWWNPAVEDQCNDRVYRIGQHKTVHVYLPCAIHPVYGDDSFDVKLHELLDRKRSRSRDVLSPPDASDRELDELFQSVCLSSRAEEP